MIGWFFVIICALFIILWCRHPRLTDPMIEEIRASLIPVHPQIRTIPIYAARRSYTLNKREVFMCLKDENGDYYDRNMIVFVFLHELAHVLNDEIGHGLRFQAIFRELLTRAIALKLYDPSVPLVKNYCTF